MSVTRFFFGNLVVNPKISSPTSTIITDKNQHTSLEVQFNDGKLIESSNPHINLCRCLQQNLVRYPRSMTVIFCLNTKIISTLPDMSVFLSDDFSKMIMHFLHIESILRDTQSSLKNKKIKICFLSKN